MLASRSNIANKLTGKGRFPFFFGLLVRSILLHCIGLGFVLLTKQQRIELGTMESLEELAKKRKDRLLAMKRKLERPNDEEENEEEPSTSFEQDKENDQPAPLKQSVLLLLT